MNGYDYKLITEKTIIYNASMLIDEFCRSNTGSVISFQESLDLKNKINDYFLR